MPLLTSHNLILKSWDFAGNERIKNNMEHLSPTTTDDRSSCCTKETKFLTILLCDFFCSLSFPFLMSRSLEIPPSKKGWILAAMDRFRKFEAFLLRIQLVLLGSTVLFGRNPTLVLKVEVAFLGFVLSLVFAGFLRHPEVFAL